MPVQQTKKPIRVLALDNNHYEIFYTLDGRDPSPKTGIQYKEPIVIDKDVTIKAIAVDAKGHQSKVAEAHYVRYTRDKDLTYLTKPDPQYFAGGEVGLVDNLRGKVNYRIGGWQGFTTDCEVVIDLRENDGGMHEVGMALSHKSGLAAWKSNALGFSILKVWKSMSPKMARITSPSAKPR